MSNIVLSAQNSIEAQLAQANAWAKSSLVPDAYKGKPDDILVAVAMGQELGFKALQSLQLINVITGRPALSLNAYMALCRQHGGKYEVVESSEKKCEVKVTRGDETWTETFSLLDAQAQGLLSKSNWQKMPKQMLFARALSQAIRRLFADVVNGLYSVEELQDGSNEPISATTVTEAAKKGKKAKEPLKVGVPSSALVFDAEEIETELLEQPPLPGFEEAEEVVTVEKGEGPVFDANDPKHTAELCLAFSNVFGKTPTNDQLKKLIEKIASERPEIPVSELQAYFESKKSKA